MRWARATHFTVPCSSGPGCQGGRLRHGGVGAVHQPSQGAAAECLDPPGRSRRDQAQKEGVPVGAVGPRRTKPPTKPAQVSGAAPRAQKLTFGPALLFEGPGSSLSSLTAHPILAIRTPSACVSRGTRASLGGQQHCCPWGPGPRQAGVAWPASAQELDKLRLHRQPWDGASAVADSGLHTPGGHC